MVPISTMNMSPMTSWCILQTKRDGILAVPTGCSCNLILLQLVTITRHFVVGGVGVVIGGDGGVAVAISVVDVIVFVAGDADSTGFAGVGVTGIVVTGIVVVGVDGVVVGGGEVDIDGGDVVDIVAEMLLRL